MGWGGGGGLMCMVLCKGQRGTAATLLCFLAEVSGFSNTHLHQMNKSGLSNAAAIKSLSALQHTHWHRYWESGSITWRGDIIVRSELHFWHPLNRWHQLGCHPLRKRGCVPKGKTLKMVLPAIKMKPAGLTTKDLIFHNKGPVDLFICTLLYITVPG